jgi:hypothetical protein
MTNYFSFRIFMRTSVALFIAASVYWMILGNA